VSIDGLCSFPAIHRMVLLSYRTLAMPQSVTQRFSAARSLQALMTPLCCSALTLRCNSCRMLASSLSTLRSGWSRHYQLFTIFVPHADYSFPVCYALMTRKTTDLYRAVLERLHQLAPQFAPTRLIADFEDAPAAAFRVDFGEQLQSSGCWFHYAQAVIRRMKKLGLQKAYTTDEQTQLAFRCVLSLPLLPCNDIEPGLGDVKLLNIDDSASNQLMQQLFRYVERHWIKKSSIGPSRLSVCDNTS